MARSESTSDLRQGNPVTLTSLRQLRNSWATLLEGSASPLPKEQEEKPSPQARSSVSHNGQVSRFEAQGLATRKAGFQEPGQRGQAPHTRTTPSQDSKSTTQGGAEARVTLKDTGRHQAEPPTLPRLVAGQVRNALPFQPMVSRPATPRLPNLAAGWSAGQGSDHKLANGRVVSAQIPMFSPILDQAQGSKLPGQYQPLSPLNLQGQQLAEFALRHAGHSIESLLKKAYRLDSRQKLSKAEALKFFALILKIGGDFTFSHSARVLDLAMDLADEVGVDDETRRDLELGSFLKDTGEMALLLDQSSPEKLDQIGDWLSGQDLHQAGMLHDIGKTQIPDEILYKPGKLSQEEYELMKLHPILGEKMIFPVKALRHLCPIVRGHHERWDGKGYPDGLRGLQIPLGARIIAVADVFDALVAERPYKAGLPVEKVKAILQEGRGTHFDPDLSDAFGRVLQRRYPELGNPFE